MAGIQCDLCLLDSIEVPAEIQRQIRVPELKENLGSFLSPRSY
jgi:hypothetical protein